jgi:flagellar biosynthesis anti-sigma factor FlgM
MRVEPISIAAYRKTAAPRATPPQPQSRRSGPPRDVVQFSEAAAALLKAQQSPTPAAGMSEQVAAIKQAVQSGDYQVDPQALAVKLLPHL